LVVYICMEMDVCMNYELELAYAENFALDSAQRFLCRQDYNVSSDIDAVCLACGLDSELLELTVAVLFPSAVVHMATGKSV